jgi:exopolysaccharide biosynthesis polyprenyl glycosylphosphotransferase
VSEATSEDRREEVTADAPAFAGHADRRSVAPLRRVNLAVLDGAAEMRAAESMREGERADETLRRDAVHRRLLAAADGAAVAVALVAAILAGGGSPRIAGLALIPLTIVVCKVLRLYERDEHVLHKTTLEEAPSLFSVAMAFTLLVWLGDHLVATPTLGKGQVLIAGAVFFLGVALARTAARSAGARMTTPERLVVIGSSADAARVAAKVAAVRPQRAAVVGRIPMTRERRFERRKQMLGTVTELDHILTEHQIDRVVICPAGDDSTTVLDAIRLIKASGVKVSVVPRLLEVVGTSVEFDEVCGLTLLGVRRYDLTKSSALVKRVFDLAGASAGLVLVLPVMLVAAVAVKLSSPGPVLFRQRRIGREGEPFEMLKFRTMYVGADEQKADLLQHNQADGFFKMDDDPRVTGVGRWLRSTSFDELPQLLNVLRGDMSLVGPRPLVVEEDARVDGWFRQRLRARPGMTGAWQVLGSSRIPLREMVTIDYLYRANWSLWVDIKILLRTVPHVLGRQGR